MKTAKFHQYGGPEVLRIEESPIPEPKVGQVLVHIYASSINPVDNELLSGRITKSNFEKLPIIPGFDFAGEIEKTGLGISSYKKGDKVYGSASALDGGSGSFASFATTYTNSIAKMPENLTYKEAAAIPLTGLSALEALQEKLNLKAGEKILIHGGAGGIGSAAIQLAKYKGAYVIATTSGSTLDFVKKIGADEVIDYQKQDFETKLSGLDAVFDTVGGDTYKNSFKVLKKGGTIVSMIERPDKDLMEKYSVNAIFQNTVVDHIHLGQMTDLLSKGIIKPYIEKSFPLEKIIEAFETKIYAHPKGKIIIEIN